MILRDKVPSEFKWKIEDIYPSVEDWKIVKRLKKRKKI